MPNRPTGARHPRWNPDRIVSSHGYIKVRVGIGHPLADSRGFCYEHRLVWAASGRRQPKAHETIHHRNHDRGDNRLANLTVLSRSEHAHLHAIERRRRKDGTFAKERRVA